MTYKLEIAKKAKKFIKTLPRHEALKVTQVIDELTKTTRPKMGGKLKGVKKGDYYRTSWGNYRILYSVNDDILLVNVVEVDGRDDSYKKLNKKLK